MKSYIDVLLFTWLLMQKRHKPAQMKVALSIERFRMENMMRKVAIHNLGCKVNSYESESMEQMLRQAGYELVPFSEKVPADVYIINTCSVTNIADRKSRQMLHKAKKMNPSAVVVAAGCYVQADSKKAASDSSVDIVVGNNCKISIVEVLENYFKDQNENSRLLDLSQKQPYEELEIEQVNEHTRAYIKIQDGCNQFCSYCIIPYTRGRVRSRSLSEVTSEVTRLVQRGYQEIVLTGIHLSSYGIDTGEGSLLDVITELNKIEGLKRIRLGSLEPRIITEEFVRVLADMEKICPHFHLSLQSGCDATLKRMNRKYTTAEYFEKCELLRRYFENPAITTDVIVGFPGETTEEFEITKKFLEKVNFYEMHIFKYSRRQGTAADKMQNQIAEDIKTRRSAILLDLEKRMSAAYRRKFVGHTMPVLIEENCVADGQNFFVGYTKNYIRVQIPAGQLECLQDKANITDIRTGINEIISVKLTGLSADETVLMGELC